MRMNRVREVIARVFEQVLDAVREDIQTHETDKDGQAEACKDIETLQTVSELVTVQRQRESVCYE